MKRPSIEETDSISTVKKQRISSGEEEEGEQKGRFFQEGGGEGGEGRSNGGFRLDDDLLFEVLKHVDARSLATASCVSHQWHRAAQDERLWEIVCTRHWTNIGCGNQQLRSVVLALGGFRRLHSLCLLPLLKPLSSSSASSSLSPLPPSLIQATPPTHWGKDEVQLSLSLLSIRYFEKMNPSTNRNNQSNAPPKSICKLLEDAGSQMKNLL
ncbi:hypothetical protein AMTRI_Chr12g270140 [Amborella trichopoda]|uniref:F-box protein GID2 n=1 Tax=Amborella trichopoda TaxID=13333 RepID=W1PT56_AMBTC|nr:F-box protein GID2 [Amborella trichopoda]ERN10896.1 hypothetical protein AMTR_s00167p00079760 [Amborella trichopoda]|eukprot:XP_006849315.1 F-box protein GID2 [Amborella trichopoda]